MKKNLESVLFTENTARLIKDNSRQYVYLQLHIWWNEIFER